MTDIVDHSEIAENFYLILSSTFRESLTSLDVLGSVHLQNLIILIILKILIMSLPMVGDKSVGAGGLWLSHRVPSCLIILPAS